MPLSWKILQIGRGTIEVGMTSSSGQALAQKWPFSWSHLCWFGADFRWDEVYDVVRGPQHTGKGGFYKSAILAGNKPVRFGRGVQGESMDYLINGLRYVMAKMLNTEPIF